MEGYRKKERSSTQGSVRQPDYRKCIWTGKEIVAAVLKSAAVVVLLTYFFYRSIPAALALTPIGIGYFHLLKKRKAESARKELLLQFKDCIVAVSTSLRAGYAVENAFLESRTDMKLLYGENSMIYKELEWIRRGLVLNIPITELLLDFAVRSGCEDILQFAQVQVIAKKNGGDLSKILQESADTIGRKIDAMQEIRTVLSGRRMEQKVMKLMPFGIIGYISFCYPGYFDALYGNLLGMAIMSVCLVIYLTAYLLGDHILTRIADELA